VFDKWGGHPGPDDLSSTVVPFIRRPPGIQQECNLKVSFRRMPSDVCFQRMSIPGDCCRLNRGEIMTVRIGRDGSARSISSSPIRKTSQLAAFEEERRASKEELVSRRCEALDTHQHMPILRRHARLSSDIRKQKKCACAACKTSRVMLLPKSYVRALCATADSSST
jgi:hypothetical protein